MLNLNTALNERIARIARKEIRKMVGSTKKSAAQHRRDIAALKKVVKALTRRLAVLEKISTKAVKAMPVESTERVRFSAKSVRSQRKRLGLSAEDFGKLVGISGLSIYNYEQGKNRPRQAQISKLASIRGIGKKEAMKRLEMMGKKKHR